MKKTITLFAILLCTASLFAQNVTFELRWDANNSLYELYVTRDMDAAAPVTTGGTSSVTIVFPSDGVAGTRTLAHTSESVSTYNSAGIIRSPEAAPDNDYYVFNSTGGSSYIGVLNAGAEVLWMTFTPSDGNSEARLFENDSDPDSTANGMMGINARSSFFTITQAGAIDEFAGNILNTPEVSELAELTLYPNPAKNKVNIVSSNPIDSVEVYDILGKQVRALNNTNEIDVSNLNAGIYLFKIWIGNKIETRKIVIE
ncbi:T9SS type A sorting domain-containing protein [Winogradskyella echinorum]|uniref:T9SS type A sorting domain-containing protein n=1 Tax=Winogradskyella echinorum TaxID=538189 RepID=A0ABR6Y3N6_9FLAO|nr:T9SS type A sorting domain-containing protein [Winogradskyella echinorum]MBC3847274.1 T9SS type A sorting domain-containing protein [Winogradskyella echinorum]MBC5751622.1 T9SS type A sorting domain-containing protein [Winogradskyella echinorum]